MKPATPRRPRRPRQRRPRPQPPPRRQPRLLIAALAAALAVVSAWALPLHAAPQETLQVRPAAKPLAGTCDPGRASLHLRVVNEGGANAASLDEAMREAARIWTPAGLRLVWTITDPANRTRLPAPDVFLVIRSDFARSRSGRLGESRQGRFVMGRVYRSLEGEVPKLIEVSLAAVGTSAQQAVHFGRSTTTLPELPRAMAIGRALGRVMAHEIGHWLFGPGHTVEGLMKTSLEPQELVALKAPALPAEWLTRCHLSPATPRLAAAPPP